MELWHLVNPKLEATVGKQMVADFLKDLCYVAIDMNVNLLKLGEEQGHEDKKSAMAYLEEAQKKQPEFINNTIQGLGEQINKEELCARMREAWFNTYKIRMGITGKQILHSIQAQDNQA